MIYQSLSNYTSRMAPPPTPLEHAVTGFDGDFNSSHKSKKVLGSKHRKQDLNTFLMCSKMLLVRDQPA